MNHYVEGWPKTLPFDLADSGPATEAIPVVPLSDAERMREALDELLDDLEYVLDGLELKGQGDTQLVKDLRTFSLKASAVLNSKT